MTDRKINTASSCRFCLLFFTPIALLILLTGYWYYNSLLQSLFEQSVSKMAAIADLEAKEIQHWRRERLYDIRRLSGDPFLKDVIERLSAKTNDEELLGKLGNYLSAALGNGLYEEVLIADNACNIIRSTGSSHAVITPAQQEAISRGHFADNEIFEDFTYSNDGVMSDLLAAIPGGSAKAIGFARFRNNLSKTLFRQLHLWPEFENNSEMLLVHRKRDEAIILNEPALKSELGSTLRLPISRTELSEVQAVLGTTGKFSGKDHRDKDVIAWLNPIPNYSWFMVIKTDKAAILSQARSQGLMIITVVICLLMLTGLLTARIFKYRQLELAGKLQHCEIRQFSAYEQFRVTLYSIGDGVITVDREGHIGIMNSVAQELTGWTESEASGKNLYEVFHIINEESRAEVENPVDRVLREERVVGLANHTILIARDGSERAIADSASPIVDKQGAITGAVLVFRDQTAERHEQKKLLHRLNMEKAVSRFSLELLDLESDQFNSAVNEGLKTIGTLTAADRSYVIQFDEKDNTMTNTYEYCLPGIEPQIENFRNVPSDTFSWGMKRLHDFERIRISKVSELPTEAADEKAILESQGIQSLLAVPMVWRKKLIGFIGFDAVKSTRLWSDEDVNTLDTFANILSLALVQRQAESELKMSNLRALSVFDGIDDQIYVCDPVSYELLYVNAPLLRMLGEPKGRKCYEYLQNRADPCPYCTNDRIFAPDFEGTYIWEHRNEITGRWYRCADKVTRWPDDRRVRCEIASDITDLKQALEEAAYARKSKEDIFHAIDHPVLILDCEHTIISANAATAEASGLPLEAIIGKKCFELFHESRTPPTDCPLSACMTNESPESREMLIESWNGIFLVNTVPIYDESGKIEHFIHVATDITELRKSEGERAALEEQIRQSQKMEAIGLLAGGIAHDFNNMLAVIIGYTDLALSKIESTHAVHEDLIEILQAGKRSTELVDHLLAFARRQTVAPRLVNLNQIIDQTFNMLKRLIGEDKKLILKPSKHPCPVIIDPAQINQILANLILNARDAVTQNGLITIETSISDIDDDYCRTHMDFIPGHYVLVAVSDDGCGMNKETMARIFEPFFTTKSQGQGTGLGLATVFGIVKQNHGFVNVYSEPGHGTVFKIYLPCCDLTEGTAEKQRPETITHKGGETILLVEDEEALLRLEEHMLKKLGYNVLTAAGPKQALEIAQKYKHEIHLLLTDVVMPEMNGSELMHNMQTVRPAIQCLFTSGYTADIVAHHGILNEGIHFIGKPFSSNMLSRKLNEVLSQN